MSYDQKIIGYRSWIINEELRLAPTNVGEPWSQGVNEAECRAHEIANYLHDEHEVPTQECECGFHSWFSLERARDHYEPWGSEVMGICLNWGRVAVHPEGMRSQFSEVLGLIFMEGGSLKEATLASATAKRYCVAVVHEEGAENWAAEHGATIPEDDRPVYPRQHPPTKGNSLAAFSAVLKSVYPPLIFGHSHPTTEVHVAQPGDVAREIQAYWTRQHQPPYQMMGLRSLVAALPHVLLPGQDF